MRWYSHRIITDLTFENTISFSSKQLLLQGTFGGYIFTYAMEIDMSESQGAMLTSLFWVGYHITSINYYFHLCQPSWGFGGKKNGGKKEKLTLPWSQLCDLIPVMTWVNLIHKHFRKNNSPSGISCCWSSPLHSVFCLLLTKKHVKGVSGRFNKVTETLSSWSSLDYLYKYMVRLMQFLTIYNLDIHL